MSSYHGPTPVTKDDIKMAKKHLKATYKLNKQKIKDHQDAMKDAAKSGLSKSVSYNQSHLSGHQKDNQKIQRSMKTANSLTPSPGLANFAAKNKVGAKAMSKMIGAKK
jgi:hypothetical protein